MYCPAQINYTSPLLISFEKEFMTSHSRDVTLERWYLMKEKLKYRYERLMGGAILT
ncbi:hypothetical protein NUACC26_045280 [Scytonema sp. NUACC26]